MVWIGPMKRLPILLATLVVACKTKAPPEPRHDPQPQTQGQAQPMVPAAASTMTVAHVQVSPDDPMHGNFTLDMATAGLPPGDLTATIDSTHGKLTCKLFADKAPIT